MLKQPKAFVAVEDCQVIISTPVCVDTMLRLQETSIGVFDGGESVIARGKFEGNEPLNQNISY
jgi:hypothetical protein